jgi:starch synthase (maltosyl-transferring)
MHRLAKLGFTQSYTYFTWRNTKQELTDYFTELRRGPGATTFGPMCGRTRPTSCTRPAVGLRAVRGKLVLAATLSANYGIYGPTYELMESRRANPGARNTWIPRNTSCALEPRPADSLWPLIARMNRIRRENPALQSDRTLSFCTIDNDS